MKSPTIEDLKAFAVAMSFAAEEERNDPSFGEGAAYGAGVMAELLLPAVDALLFYYEHGNPEAQAVLDLIWKCIEAKKNA